MDHEIVEGRIDESELVAKVASPRAGAITLSLYDPSYYVELLPNGHNSVSFEGDAPAGCRHIIGANRAVPLFSGKVFPEIIELVCGGRAE